jgi:hypothetical protein
MNTKLNTVTDGIGRPVRLFVTVVFTYELGDGKLTCSVHTNKEIELALHRLNLGEFDMKEADGECLNCCRFGLSPSTSGKRDMPCF